MTNIDPHHPLIDLAMYRLLLALFLLTTTSLSARNLDSLMRAYGLVEVTSVRCV